MELLKEKQEEDRRRLEEQFEERNKAQQEQMENMMKANMEQMKEDRERMLNQNKGLEVTYCPSTRRRSNLVPRVSPRGAGETLETRLHGQHIPVNFVSLPQRRSILNSDWLPATITKENRRTDVVLNDHVMQEIHKIVHESFLIPMLLCKKQNTFGLPLFVLLLLFNIESEKVNRMSGMWYHITSRTLKCALGSRNPLFLRTKGGLGGRLDSHDGVLTSSGLLMTILL